MSEDEMKLKRPRRTHAQRRLQERFGVRITREQYHQLCELMARPEARSDPGLMRAVPECLRRKHEGHIAEWWLNVGAFLAGEPLWVKVVYCNTARRIITVAPRHAPDPPRP